MHSPLTYRLIGALVVSMLGIVGAACQSLQPPQVPPPPAWGQAEPPPAQDATTAPGPARGLPVPVQRLPAGVVPAGRPTRVALVAPFSGRQQALGEAVRDGFMAAWFRADATRRPDILFIDEASGGAQAYRQAIDAGADIVVGPLLKQAVREAATAVDGVPVLALNRLDEGITAPLLFFQFGLAPEDEAREVAHRALASGQRQAIGLAPDTPWGRRLLNSFYGAFAEGGGNLLAWRFYDPGTADHSVALQSVLEIPEGRVAWAASAAAAENPDKKPQYEDFRRQDIDFIFIAANSRDARLLRPQLRFYGAGAVPTYATSAAYEDGSMSEPDLEGLMFPDCPWVVAPDAAIRRLRTTLMHHAPSSVRVASRLYALGHDSYALLPPLSDGTLHTTELAGMTGRLRLHDDGRIHRRLPWGVIRGGRLEPLPDVAPPASPDSGMTAP